MSPSAELPLKQNPLRGGSAPSSDTRSVAPQTTVRPTSTNRSVAAPLKQPPKGKHGAPFDPIKENGPIFVDWTKPKLAFVITGRQDGYLEPCGCAGLDRMKGGFSRRHTMFEELRAKGWPIVALDVGGMIKGYGRQAELKLQITAEAMRKMRYEAIALGKTDLRLPTAELVAVVAGVQGRQSTFVSANVGLFGFDSGMTSKKRIVEAGGLKVGVTAILGKREQKEINNPEIEMADPEAAIRKVLPELKKEKCDLLVLLAHASMEESEELAKTFPDFDILVTAGGEPEPPIDKPPVIGEKTRLVKVGEKGMNAIVLGLFDGPSGAKADLHFRYQRVPLDSRFPASPEMKALMHSYQDQLRDLTLGSLVRAVPNSREELLGKFVGSAKCESCHEPSYNVWKKSPHRRAYETLVKADPPRNNDPECLSCHVIGWHPTEHFPYQGGFWSMEKTPELTDVGCESCHGPGGAHVEAEMKGDKGDKALLEKLRKAIVLTKAEAEKRFCYECHDLDNSPDFDFSTYWPKIEHKEKE